MKIERKAKKDLMKMPKKIAQQFMSSFEKIETNDTIGLDIKKMKNSTYFRLRIGGYRAIYSHNLEVIVIDAGSRGRIYK